MVIYYINIWGSRCLVCFGYDLLGTGKTRTEIILKLMLLKCIQVYLLDLTLDRDQSLIKN